MNASILNRNFEHPADGWYHIEPKGKHFNAGAEVTQVIDNQAITSIVNRFNAEASAGTLPHGHEMLIDHEHFKHDAGKETRAFGWLTRLQNRGDGIYGQIRWTGTGEAAVNGGDYRFFSTEYDPADVEILNRDGGKITARPLRLSGLTLTNSPNNKGAKPITNRHLQAETQTKIKNEKSNTMKQVAQTLGLSAEASEEAIVAELTRITNRVAQMLDEQIDTDLDSHGIKDSAVRNKLKTVLAGMEDRAARVEFLGIINRAEPRTPEGRLPLTNREKAKTPSAKEMETDDEQHQRERATKISNRAAELKSVAPGRSFQSCWNQSRAELAGKGAAASNR